MGQEPRPEAAIGLAELIVAVRDELEKADTARLDRADDALLELREVELELQFEVRRTRPGRGGLDFRVLSAGAPSTGTSAPAPAAQAQRLRVLYGPAFKLIEIDEGDDGVPDWLRTPSGGTVGPSRLEIDDELEGLADLGLASDVGEDAEHPERADADTSDV